MENKWVKKKLRIHNVTAKAALKFRSEAWVLKKREEQRLEAAQMKFLRHLLVITKLDKEKNQCIRGETGAQNIGKEIRLYCTYVPNCAMWYSIRLCSLQTPLWQNKTPSYCLWWCICFVVDCVWFISLKSHKPLQLVTCRCPRVEDRKTEDLTCHAMKKLSNLLILFKRDNSDNEITKCI